MDLVDEFFQKENDFAFKIQYEIEDELNKGIKLLMNNSWGYNDGYFSLILDKPKTILILKSDFEPYTFNTLQIIHQEYMEEIPIIDIDSVNQKLNEILGE